MQKRIEKIEKILASKNLEIMFARIASNLLKRDNLEEAIQICEHGLKKFSTYAQGHYVLAKCYLQKGMAGEARAEFERALKFDFTHINSLRELARIYKTAGLEDYYKEYLLKLFTIDPLNKEIVGEVKEIGKYDNWIIQEDSFLKTTVQKTGAAAGQTQSNDNGTPHHTETTGKKPDRPLDNLYNRDKVDLSQFNNMQDDFTTILQGKQVSSEQGGLQTGSTAPPMATGKSEWIEDITYSYSDDAPLTDQKDVTNAENGGEEIETAVRDLSFEEETEKIIEKERLKGEAESTTQIALTFPVESTGEKVTDEESASTTIAGAVQPPTGKVRELKVQEEVPTTDDRENAHDTSRGFSLITGEEEESLPFKPPKIISQTLGEILVSQKKYMEALEVFEILRQKNPENKNFDKKIEFLQKIIALEEGQHH